MMDDVIEIRPTHEPSSESEYEGLCFIKDFRNLPYNEDDDYEQSPSFFTGQNREYEWTLDIFANGYDDKHLEYVAIQFYLINADEVDINLLSGLRFTASIIDKCGKKYLTKSTFYESEKTSTTFKDFVLKDDLLSDSSLLPNDELRIAFEISYYASHADKGIRPSQKNQLKLLGKVFDAGNYTDFKFIVESQEFRVHRAILAARSPVFEAMFASEMRESNEGKVEIVDVEAKVMEKLLRFVYVGDVEDIEDVADKVLEAAEKYQVDELKHLCEDVLAERLSVTNVYDTLLFADENNAEYLKKKTMEFFHRNARKLYRNADFKAQINALPGHLKTDIICIFIDMN